MFCFPLEREEISITLAAMSSLSDRQCIPCRGGVPPLKQGEAEELLSKLSEGWRVVANHQLERDYRLPDFKTALAWTNRIGELAEQQDHHPDLFLSWGKVKVVIWTHAVDGLTESDFILAAKIDVLDNGG